MYRLLGVLLSSLSVATAAWVLYEKHRELKRDASEEPLLVIRTQPRYDSPPERPQPDRQHLVVQTTRRFAAS